jgi:hypothetical protein
MCFLLIRQRYVSMYVSSHKNATVLVNDIKRYQAQFEDILKQCSIEACRRTNDHVIELERLMVIECLNVNDNIFNRLQLLYSRMFTNVLRMVPISIRICER